MRRVGAALGYVQREESVAIICGSGHLNSLSAAATDMIFAAAAEGTPIRIVLRVRFTQPFYPLHEVLRV